MLHDKCHSRYVRDLSFIHAYKAAAAAAAGAEHDMCYQQPLSLPCELRVDVTPGSGNT